MINSAIAMLETSNYAENKFTASISIAHAFRRLGFLKMHKQLPQVVSALTGVSCVFHEGGLPVRQGHH